MKTIAIGGAVLFVYLLGVGLALSLYRAGDPSPCTGPLEDPSATVAEAALHEDLRQSCFGERDGDYIAAALWPFTLPVWVGMNAVRDAAP